MEKAFDVEYHLIVVLRGNLCSHLCVWVGFKGFKYYG